MAVSKTILDNLGFSFVQSARGIDEYKLDANGLKILLSENHMSPVVTTLIVYRVGSRNEAVGATGSTHFLEHMMFKSTDKYDHAKGQGIDDVLKPVGASYNATTSEDRTCYFGTMPREHLRLSLSLEADRMRGVRLLKEDATSEMTVVRSEFEIGENDPDQLLVKELTAMAFREHPYHHPTIGWRSDVEGVPLEKLQAFYDTFYWPNNATVMVAGDFEPTDALAMIAEEFGKIPSSPRPIPQVYTTEPPQEGTRRFVLRKVGEDLPTVALGFHIPAATHGDFHALMVVKDLLSGGKSSRFYKGLMETGLAASVSAHCQESRDPGLFIAMGTVTPAVEPEKLESGILEQLRQMAEKPVAADELARIKAANRSGTLVLMDDQSNLLQQLCEGEAVADWRWIVDFDERYEAVTPQDIMRVAKLYFVEDNLTVGHYLPVAPQSDSEVTPQSSAGQPESGTTDDGSKLGAASSFAARVKRTTLSNGLTLLVMPAAGSGVVAVSGKIRAGKLFSPERQELVKLTAWLLTDGSKRFSKAQLSDRLLEMGTDLSFSGSTFSSDFSSVMGKDNFESYVELFADVVINPLFEQEELKRLARQVAGSMQASASEPAAAGAVQLSQLLYQPGHVFHKKSLPEQIAELQSISRDEIAAFHRRFYTPANTIITVVGDLKPAEVAELFEKHLAGWQGGKADAIEVPAVEMPVNVQRVEVAMADKTSVDIFIGVPVPLKRADADFNAARLANAALGLDTISSRLGAILREKHGLTYGINSMFQDPTFGMAPWMIHLSVNPANSEKALALVAKVMEDYRTNGITEKELSDESGRAYGLAVVGLSNSRGLADTLTALEFSGVGAEALDKLENNLRSVTCDQANQAIRKYFRVDLAATVLAGVPK